MKAWFKNKKTWIAVFAFIAVCSVGFISIKDKEFEIVKNLEIFTSLFNELDRYYVDETKPDELIESAIQGMLESLDPYTSYIPEKDLEDFNFMLTQEYGGIGALIRKSGDFSMIVEPYESFPAQTAGLKAGDTILKIDGVSTRGKEISSVSELLKGTPNTELKLTLKRPGTQGEIEKTLIRQKISIPNVWYYGMIDDQVGYISLRNFTKDASQETKNALNQLKKQGAKSIILDLRGNPGGLLLESVNITNLFIPKNREVVSTKGKAKQWDNVYKTMYEPVDTGIPLAVLVNRGSASASEIVAGALQDLDRAVVIGQRTFGKGLVQTTRPLNYNSQLKVTTAKYYIPSGRCIQAVDYSHRNEDGSVGYVPDSLINEFSTAHGRKVFDGGGVAPDIAIDQNLLSNIAISLYAKNLIFDFATLYAQELGTVQDVSQVLKFGEPEYNRFIEFLKGKSYDYTTRSDDKLNELIKTAEEEKYYDLAKAEFNALKTKLAHDKDKDLQTFKEEIIELLREEIASRFYYQKGRIQASLTNDPELNKAVEVLRNPQSYSKILDKSYGQSNIRAGMQKLTN